MLLHDAMSKSTRTGIHGRSGGAEQHTKNEEYAQNNMALYACDCTE
jgi:hypothetical protein